MASLGFENGLPSPTSSTAADAALQHNAAKISHPLYRIMPPPLAFYAFASVAWGPPCRERTLARLIKRSFSLAGHRTSVALEPAFWDVLNEAAGTRNMSLAG